MQEVLIYVCQLQQHLPFTVLKLVFSVDNFHDDILLQQHLPFTVLKQYMRHNHNEINIVEHVLQQHLPFTVLKQLAVDGIKSSRQAELQQHLPLRY